MQTEEVGGDQGHAEEKKGEGGDEGMQMDEPPSEPVAPEETEEGTPEVHPHPTAVGMEALFEAAMEGEGEGEEEMEVEMEMEEEDVIEALQKAIM
jgi:hypothetical protein